MFETLTEEDTEVIFSTPLHMTDILSASKISQRPSILKHTVANLMRLSAPLQTINHKHQACFVVHILNIVPFSQLHIKVLFVQHCIMLSKTNTSLKYKYSCDKTSAVEVCDPLFNGSV